MTNCTARIVPLRESTKLTGASMLPPMSARRLSISAWTSRELVSLLSALAPLAILCAPLASSATPLYSSAAPALSSPEPDSSSLLPSARAETPLMTLPKPSTS